MTRKWLDWSKGNFCHRKMDDAGQMICSCDNRPSSKIPPSCGFLCFQMGIGPVAILAETRQGLSLLSPLSGLMLLSSSLGTMLTVEAARVVPVTRCDLVLPWVISDFGTLLSPCYGLDAP